jgi:hypothetical protein
MDNPMNVIGTSGSNRNYQNGIGSGADRSRQPANSSDLYEFDNDAGSSSVINNASGHVKKFLSSLSNQRDGRANDDTSSIHQYKRDVFDTLCTQINQTLIIPKAFYFFFFAAFGSLFPLMAIYFKQMAMSPVQVGFLFGFRPFIEFLSVPFWANLSERWRKGKLILLASLSCWLIFTLGVGFIKPPVHSCLMHNGSHIFFEKSKSSTGARQASASNTIISGGYRVINKRDIDSERWQDELFTDELINEQRNELQKGLDMAPFIIKKRQASTINSKKNKVSSTTLKTTTINQNDVTVELEFTRKPPSKSKIKAGSSKNKHNPVIDQAINDVKDKIVTESQANSVNEASDDSKSKTNVNSSVIDKAIEKTIDKLTSNIKNNDDNSIASDNDEKLEKTLNKKNTKKPTIKIASTSPKIMTFSQSMQPYVVPVMPEKSNYFDSSPLESSKARNRIIYLNNSALDLVKPKLQTSIVYHRDDVERIFLIFLVFILAGSFTLKSLNFDFTILFK